MARAAAEVGQWEAASALYAAVAEDAAGAGVRDVAQQAWSQAGDALRRDDRPAEAVEALRQALALLEVGDGALASRRAVATAELAGVLVDTGALAEARELARAALTRQLPPGSRTLLLDTLAGCLLALGEVAEAAMVVGQLAEVAPPGARISVAFREAALHRLAGRLTVATLQLESVRGAVADVPAARGAWAAATAELGEIELLRGEPREARQAFEAAAAAWREAGRRSGLLRSQAALLRADLALGERPLGTGLTDGIAFAMARAMPLLEAELRMARGMARPGAR